MSNPAETYESYMVPAIFAPWASRLLETAVPKPGERVLDLACGTGIVGRQAAKLVEPGGSVTGLDLNPNMLEVARAAAQREGVEIDWREGRAEAMPFADGSLDVALCQFALMFFEEPQAAMEETRRVLDDRGRVALSVWQGLDWHPFYQTLHEVIERRAGISALQQIFAMGDDAELRRLLTGSGFRDVQIESSSLVSRFPDPQGFLAGEIDVDTAAIPSMQQLDGAARQEITAAIARDMDGPLREVTDGDHVALTFHAHLASAWKA